MATEKAIALKDLEKGVDPYIANTRLAFHLLNLKKQFHNSVVGELADKALKGQWSSPEGGIFSRLGSALKERGLALAKAYNFDRIDSGLTVDKEIGDYLKTVVKSNHGNKLYRKVAETFSPLASKDLQGNPLKKHEQFDEFWDNLRTHVTNKLGKGSNVRLPASALTDEMLHKSLRRLAYKEDDMNDAKTQEILFPKKNPKVSRNGSLTWQDNLSQLPSNTFVDDGKPTTKVVARTKPDHPEAYKRKYDNFLLQYMSEDSVGRNPHIEEFIEEMKDKGKEIKEIREALEHEFHMNNEEAAKAIIGYALPLPPLEKKYNEIYSQQLQ